MNRVIRILVAALGGVAGYYLSIEWLYVFPALGVTFNTWEVAGFVALLTIAGFAAFYALAPAITDGIVQLTRWLEARLFRIPAGEMAFGALGVVFGLIMAFLLGPSLAKIPTVGNYLPAITSFFLGYLGWTVAVRKREDLMQLLPLARLRDGVTAAAATKAASDSAEAVAYKVLDTSAIIDGRIVDLCRTGFLEGVLVVPQFVLDELRHIADSSDPLRRNRGRRGLDVLNTLQSELQMPVIIDEREIKGADEVDTKLLLLAREIGGKVLTNDFNLSKVAQVQGVPVLNINELANALKPVVLPGEGMTVQILREGKEPGQGVGFLDDGTMVVVDGGKRHVGETIDVEVTSVLQTNAGRMIFAKARQAVAHAN
ncbi:MAG: TRAM domain-containing protein [Clostridia bacterium]|nr:TRAM domain-containing protein [Clostridia bacterium]